MAKQERITLKKFQKKFNSEQACREHLFHIRWPNGFCCPKCQNKSFYFLKKRALYQCTCCKHRYLSRQVLLCTNPTPRCSPGFGQFF